MDCTHAALRASASGNGNFSGFRARSSHCLALGIGSSSGHWPTAHRPMDGENRRASSASVSIPRAAFTSRFVILMG